jgi:hypothetical protein
MSNVSNMLVTYLAAGVHIGCQAEVYHPYALLQAFSNNPLHCCKHVRHAASAPGIQNLQGIDRGAWRDSNDRFYKRICVVVFGGDDACDVRACRDKQQKRNTGSTQARG